MAHSIAPMGTASFCPEGEKDIVDSGKQLLITRNTMLLNRPNILERVVWIWAMLYSKRMDLDGVILVII